MKPCKSVGAEENVSKPGTTFGVGIGIGIDLYERHSEQGLILFDPDTATPTPMCAAHRQRRMNSAKKTVLRQPLETRPHK